MEKYTDVTEMWNFVAFDGTPAAVAGHMFNFDEGKSILKPGHEAWLREEAVSAIMARPNAWLDFHDYASKKGNKAQLLEWLRKEKATYKLKGVDALLLFVHRVFHQLYSQQGRYRPSIIRFTVMQYKNIVRRGGNKCHTQT